MEDNSASSVPRHRPSIREWELTSNSTIYDHLLAAPSDDDLMKMWIGFSVVTGLCSILTIVVFMGVISSRKTRSNPFNLYLLFLLVPDMLVSIFCFFTCTQNIINGQYTSEWTCLFQSFYIMFSVSSNAWLNAVIARHLYRMLCSARSFHRYKPPSKKRIVMESMSVYAFGVFLGSWGLLDQAWWPYRIQSLNGMACFPVQYDKSSTFFFYFAFVPCFIGIPLLYVIWVTYQILRKKILPPSGRRRMLAIYFLRLDITFIAMWLPFFVLTFICGQWMSAWVSYGGAMWGHLQATVSAVVSLMKPDIYKAVLEFLSCRTCFGCGSNGTTSRLAEPSTVIVDNITQTTLHSKTDDEFSVDTNDRDLLREWDRNQYLSTFTWFLSTFLPFKVTTATAGHDDINNTPGHQRNNILDDNCLKQHDDMENGIMVVNVGTLPPIASYEDENDEEEEGEGDDEEKKEEETGDFTHEERSVEEEENSECADENEVQLCADGRRASF